MAESIQRREGILSQTFSLNNAPDERDNMEIGDRNGATVSDQVEQFSEMVNLPEGDSAVPGNLSLQAMGDDGLSGGDGRAGNQTEQSIPLEIGAGEPDTLESQDANQADQASVNIEGPGSNAIDPTFSWRRYLKTYRQKFWLHNNPNLFDLQLMYHLQQIILTWSS
ncbi:E3 ubiquitin-protein ligase UPL1-like [Hibiscus syriacus]|uniref:E3 ubiquitin-protein ligase UPL1-like n=1 Tax=Hibiscus syriacus TaxID=106335 RepID=UPI001920A891|nr:E3 ubiquitin-protein ligase UPL1-like [Hibiscus syriacus]